MLARDFQGKLNANADQCITLIREGIRIRDHNPGSALISQKHRKITEKVLGNRECGVSLEKKLSRNCKPASLIVGSVRYI